MPPIRLAIVGLGKIARDQHVPAVALCAPPQLRWSQAMAALAADVRFRRQQWRPAPPQSLRGAS
ncbi:hypothetical protein B5U98_03305 [Bosea sp. Tri-39]|nr:hypothetical protein BLM15_26150 [Bosea sp. Tri-49]RXT25619.1 hypothetical protein B5U98_03305 [Bosea sp. Tri-39]RXT30860.1 hypothetical protein B5U99_18850 [Bosea sp. Tri-54]